MKNFVKRSIGWLLSITIIVVGIVLPIPAYAARSEYGPWGGWSDWQDSPVSESEFCNVETRQAYVSTTYHYFRYSNQYAGGYGSYYYSSTYPNYYEYDFDSELGYSGNVEGYNRYQWWYNGTNYVSVYARSPYTTDNYKTQYRYRTRGLIYYYEVSYNANGGSGAPSKQEKKAGTTLTLSNTVPTKSYSITYNANGGTVPSSTKTISCTFNNWKASNGTTYNKGASYTSDSDTIMVAQWTNPVAGDLLVPTRTGYAFDGWFTASSAGNKVTESSTISSNITLYAHWTAIDYSVKYNGNGNTSGVMTNSIHSFDTEKQLTQNSFEKTGYTFSSWNTKSDGTGSTYMDEESVKNLSSTSGSEIELYAQWTPNQYTIHYDGNGYTEGEMVDSESTYDVEMVLAQNTYKKMHYKFIGWNTKADGTGDSYLDSESVLNLTATNHDTVTLYAQWTINEYQVTFDANGGTNVPSSQTKIHNEALILTDETPEKTYTINYELSAVPGTASWPSIESTEQNVNSCFAKWNTLADGSGTNYNPGDTYNANAPLKLFAIWSGASQVVLYTPTRDGYTFNGWYGVYNSIDPTTGMVNVASSGMFSTPATLYGDVTLYAQWSSNQYTVNFNPLGGICSSKSKTVTFDSIYGELPTPSKAGCIFDGWYTLEEGGIKVSQSDKVNTASNVTLYARWIEKSVSSICVNLEKTKTVYYIGDAFDSSQIALDVTYTDGEVQTIYSGFECTTPTLNKISKKRVTVSYKGFSAYYSIDIVNAPLQDISIVSMPQKTSYYVGDEISTEGLVVQATYTNGYVKELTSGYNTNYDFSSNGIKTVEVTYTEGDITKNTTFTVTVLKTATVFSDSIVTTNGNTVSIPVYISDNTGIMGFGIEVEYNGDVMTPLSVEKGNMLEGSFDNSISTSANNSFKVFWTGSKNTTDNGLLFTMKFSIANNSLGSYDLAMTVLEDDTFNESWENVKLNCQSIAIEINGANGNSTTVYSDNLTVETGTRFEMPIRIINNHGIGDVSFILRYDKDVFNPVNFINGLATVKRFSANSSTGELNIEVNPVPSTAGSGVLFTVVWDTSYCPVNDYVLSIESKGDVFCIDSNIKVKNGAAKILAKNISINDDYILVPIHIKGNTGTMGFRLNFSYDNLVLAPVSVTPGGIITSGIMDDTIGESNDGQLSVVWVGNDNISLDGELFVIKFRLIDSSKKKTDLSIAYVQADTYNSNWEDVKFNCENKSILCRTEIGDTNLDGKIDIRDVTAIQRHLAELERFPDEYLDLADTNGDGVINIIDATHLQKYLAEFDGIVLGKQPET